MNLPFSQACENNKQPIAQVLQRAFKTRQHVLEIGSGTGQHAVHFAAALPHLVWQTTDLESNLPGIRARLTAHPQPNLPPPQEFDMAAPTWPDAFDAVFSANTAHIMPWALTRAMVRGVGEQLPDNGLFALYGPFNYRGAYTSASNAQFDSWLKGYDPDRGIRDFEAMNALAGEVGLLLQEDNAMPANNRLLLWRKTASA